MCGVSRAFPGWCERSATEDTVSRSIIESPDADSARLEGFEVGRSGKSFALCPYPPRTTLRTAWLDGYRLAINPVAPAAKRYDFRTAVAS